MISKVFNTMASIFNYVPEKTEAMTRKLLNGMKNLRIQTLNNAYDYLENQSQTPALVPIPVRNNSKLDR